jgi:hypothetical protein
VGSSFKDRDNGYRALVRRVYGMKAPVITVGILAEAGKESHGDDSLTVLEVAVFNEFGTDRIPERSFIRAWFDENESRLGIAVKRMTASVIAGKRTKEQALELLAQACVGQIQKRIANGISPPNAESTIAQKGSSKPLIGVTGQLRTSISYRVDK